MKMLSASRSGSGSPRRHRLRTTSQRFVCVRAETPCSHGLRSRLTCVSGGNCQLVPRLPASRTAIAIQTAAACLQQGEHKVGMQWIGRPVGPLSPARIRLVHPGRQQRQDVGVAQRGQQAHRGHLLLRRNQLRVAAHRHLQPGRARQWGRLGAWRSKHVLRSPAVQVQACDWRAPHHFQRKL